jgi:hypothetical protein
MSDSAERRNAKLPEGVEANEAGAIPPEGVRVWEDEFHQVHVNVQGKELENVRPVQCFPISGKTDYVSFLDQDGKEVLLLAHPGGLDKDSRLVVNAALEKMYYVAKITRVDSITETMGVSHWRVMTDRGYAAFEVVDREHIRRLPGRRYMITDVDGNRFEIEDTARLDARSQALIHSET